MISLEASTLPTLVNQLELLVGPVTVRRVQDWLWLASPTGDPDTVFVFHQSEAGWSATGK